MIKLAIAEDHNALIDGMRVYLEYKDDITLVGHANNGKELLELVSQKKPDIVISDIRMPVMDGIEATRMITKDFPETKVIAFTMYDQDEAVNDMISAGAKGYLLKNSSLDTLLKAVHAVFAGETFHDVNITPPEKLQSDNKSKSILTKRQVEILKKVALGKTNQEIADELFIGKTTVETHRKNMIKKLGLQGAGELLRYAIEKKYNY